MIGRRRGCRTNPPHRIPVVIAVQLRPRLGQQIESVACRRRLTLGALLGRHQFEALCANANGVSLCDGLRRMRSPRPGCRDDRISDGGIVGGDALGSSSWANAIVGGCANEADSGKRFVADGYPGPRWRGTGRIRAERRPADSPDLGDTDERSAGAGGGPARQSTRQLAGGALGREAKSEFCRRAGNRQALITSPRTCGGPTVRVSLRIQRAFTSRCCGSLDDLCVEVVERG